MSNESGYIGYMFQIWSHSPFKIAAIVIPHKYEVM